MAFYYLDPHTQSTSGTGTWASPFSAAVATRTGVVAGDEIRIRGVPLTSLLTATTYLGTWSAVNGITLTSGSGLDFAGGDIAYFPQFGTFWKILSSTATSLSAYTNNWVPIHNTALTAGTLQIRRVDTTTYPPSLFAANTIYYLGQAAVNNVRVTDCWTADGTRVTDGSVKSLFNSAGTGFGTTVYLDTSDTLGRVGWTVDIPNTHIMHNINSTSGSTLAPYILTSNSSITVGQLWCNYSGGGLNIGTNACYVHKTRANVEHMSLALVNQAYGSNLTVTTSNLSALSMETISSLNATYGRDITFNIGQVTTRDAGTTIVKFQQSNSHTFNFTANVDIWQNAAPSMLTSGAGYGSATFPANFSVKYNKRATTLTNITSQYGYGSGDSQAAGIFGNVLNIPTVPMPTGMTRTYPMFHQYAYTNSTSISKPNVIPDVTYLNVPISGMANNATNGNWGQGLTFGRNIVVVSADGQDPVEICSVFGNAYTIASQANGCAQFPLVYRDTAFYRTSSPSLKSILTTRTAAMWNTYSGSPDKVSKSAKSIKIPVTASTPVTVSGYIYCNDAAYANGDCVVSLIDTGVQQASQSMTTACINNWSQFTMSYTPTQTGEATFLWTMYYANGGKSYWLDDLTIT